MERKQQKIYISVQTKFILSHGISFLWLLFSIWISQRWLIELAEIVGLYVAIFIIMGIAYIPGYLNAFLVASLLLDRQPSIRDSHPTNDVTILIAAYNEEKVISETLKYIHDQEYAGTIKVLLIDNNSTDQTSSVASLAAEEMGLPIKILYEPRAGKNFALNTGLQHVDTEFVITLDADTVLHKLATRHIVARFHSSPSEVCAVAGAVLVKNSRENLLARIQEWDYFLSIASVKRLQGLYQGTLVAQGAFSIYHTAAIKEVGGWSDCIGEDIVLTWKFLAQGKKVYFEPLAVAFTEVPTKLTHFTRQRSRWARGMIEGLKEVKPWQQPMPYAKYLTGTNLVMPYLDFIYTFVWLPGMILAFFGHFWIVGPMTLLVLPLTLLSYFTLYTYQKSVFQSLKLKIRENKLGFIVFVLFYQMLMSPVSVWGYVQELFKLKRVWK